MSDIFYFYSTYLIIHLFVYLLLRNYSKFYGEKQIFLYHFCSASMASALLLFMTFYCEEFPLVVALGLIALHGIYSITFLEIWSLAQGSYSISILGGIVHQQLKDKPQLCHYFSAVGDQKKNDRLESLERLGLIKQQNEIWQLSQQAKIIVSILAFFRWVPNLKETG